MSRAQRSISHRDPENPSAQRHVRDWVSEEKAQVPLFWQGELKQGLLEVDDEGEDACSGNGKS